MIALFVALNLQLKPSYMVLDCHCRVWHVQDPNCLKMLPTIFIPQCRNFWMTRWWETTWNKWTVGEHFPWFWLGRLGHPHGGIYLEGEAQILHLCCRDTCNCWEAILISKFTENCHPILLSRHFQVTGFHAGSESTNLYFSVAEIVKRLWSLPSATQI